MSISTEDNIKNIFFIEVADDSMSVAGDRWDRGSINPGDKVLFDFQAPVNAGDIVLAKVDGYDVPIIRKFRLGSGAAFELVPSNPDFATIKIRRGKTGRVIARAMEIIKPM